MPPQILEENVDSGDLGLLLSTDVRCEMTQGAKQRGGKLCVVKPDREPH